MNFFHARGFNYQNLYELITNISNINKVKLGIIIAYNYLYFYHANSNSGIITLITNYTVAKQHRFGRKLTV